MNGRRLVVFAEPRSFISNVLLASVIGQCRARPDVDLVAVFDTGRGTARRRHASARIASTALIKRAFDPAHPIVLHAPMWQTVHTQAARAGVPVAAAPNVNDPAFIEALRSDYKADYALSLICLQIFGRELLGSFAAAVNYHNGLLPAYRGVRATGWSVYNGEAQTGFSFHHMTPGIDEGPVLLQDAVPLRRRASVLELEWEKTLLAASSVPRVLTAMLHGEPGAAQVGTAAYHSARDLERVVRVGDPEQITWDDLVRRIRAFGGVDMTLGAGLVRVTRVERSKKPAPRLGFRSADGVHGRATRVRYLPPLLNRLSRAVRAARPS